MRQKPKHAEMYAWNAFCRWADENGVGEHEDDWTAWWECWKAAYIAAMQG